MGEGLGGHPEQLCSSIGGAVLLEGYEMTLIIISLRSTLMFSSVKLIKQKGSRCCCSDQSPCRRIVMK